MIDPSQIAEHLPVVGSDGEHVGTVDHMDGATRIKLTKRDPESQGAHHYIPLDWVQSVADGSVKLSKSRAEAEASWQAA